MPTIMETRMPDDVLTICVRSEDGAFWATIEEYPGVFATGDTLDELWTSLQEGLGLVLAGPGEEARPVVFEQLRVAPAPHGHELDVTAHLAAA